MADTYRVIATGGERGAFEAALNKAADEGFEWFAVTENGTNCPYIVMAKAPEKRRARSVDPTALQT
jgi:hypothetical protein